MTLIVLDVSAAAMGAWCLFRLVQAFATGRARGVWLSADRASQPARFWLNVAVLVLVVAVSSTYLVWAAVASGAMVGGGFRARHTVPVDRSLPESPVARPSAAGCATPGPRVCFVAVGVAPDVPVDALGRYYSALLGSPVGILEPIALTRQAEGLPVIDERRLQVGAGAVERLVHATYPMLWEERNVTVVSLTGHDLWLEDRPNQRYAFGAATVRSAGGGFAVVSSARMDPAAYSQAADPARLERRMHTMLGKYLALLRYGATPSADPTSALYNAVQSPADLDRMQVFSPPR